MKLFLQTTGLIKPGLENKLENHVSSIRSMISSSAIYMIAVLIALTSSLHSANAQCIVPDQPGSISGNQTVCYGSIQVYAVTEVDGATSYAWTLPAGWSGTSTTNSITLTAGITGGNLSVAAVDSCGSSDPSTITISVNTIPARPGVISGPTSACTGSSQNFGVAAIPGAIYYSWTLPSGWSGMSSTNTITAIPGSTGGTVSIIAINSCGSSPANQLSVATKTVTNQPGNITGSVSICSNTARTYSISPVSGALNYTWTLPLGWSGYSTSNAITVVSNTSSGNIYVTANNACGSSTANNLSIMVGTVPAQPSTVFGNAASCGGQSEQYYVMPVSGASSYTWRLPTGWSGSSTSNSIIANTAGSGGTITVNATNTCGSGIARTLPVVLSNVPAQPGTVSGPAVACIGSSITYSISAVPGASTYDWYLPPTWTGTSDSTSITVTAGASAGTISVYANNACGSSVARDLNVTVTNMVPNPVATITGSTLVCSSSSQIYSVPTVAGATSYAWTLPSGWSGTSTTNTITAVAGSTSGNVVVTTNNNCGSDAGRSLAVVSRSAPAMPGAMTVSGGIANVCPGDTRTYVVPLVSGVSYNWTGPAALSILSGQGTNSVTVTFTNSLASTAILSVKASSSCGISAARTLTISRNVPAAPAVITATGGTFKVCPGDIRTFSVSAVSGLTYNWTLPSGAMIMSGQGTYRIVVLFNGGFTASGTLSVTASNGCSSSLARTASITRNTPAAPGMISVSGGTVKVCPGDSRTFTVTAVSGMTYNWIPPTGATITSGQGTNRITMAFDTTFTSSGNVYVAANNTCTTGPASTLVIQQNIPTTPGTITGMTSVCLGTTKIYSISAVANATSYVWTVPVGATISSGQGTTRVYVLWSSGAGNLSVVASNGCGTSVARTVSVAITCRETEGPLAAERLSEVVQIFPNPSFGITKVQFSSPTSENYTIDILDMIGRETEIKKGISNEGINIIDLDLSDYPKGIYFIHLKSGNTNELIKMMLR